MGVKPGYKETEVGVIPEDWDSAALGAFTSFLASGKTKKGTLDEGYSLWGSTGQIGHVNKAEYEGKAILVARVGANAGYIYSVDGNYGVSDNTIIIKTNSSLEQDYLEYFLRIKNLNRLVFGSGQPLITGSQLKALDLPLPPLPEQRAIASALSDTDDLIAALEALIAKKQVIKQGAMQELLTGRKRLPGFTGEWETRTIRELAPITSGGTPNTNIESYWNGSLPWMSSGELNYKRVREVAQRITERGLENSSAKMIPADCVLIGLAGQGKTRGTVAINLLPLSTNQSIAAIWPSKSYCTGYLFQNLDNRYEELRSASTGDGGRGGLNLKIIGDLEIPYPTLAEQEAISMVLSDMDNEIAQLEDQLGKARALKQGMMQELLTGRIRLV